VAGQRSSAGVLGAAAAGETFWSYVARIDAVFADWFEVAWRGVTEEQLPIKLAIDQLPRTLRTATRGFSVEYTPIPSGADAHRLERMLIVISEVTEHDAAAAFRLVNAIPGASRLSGSG